VRFHTNSDADVEDLLRTVEAPDLRSLFDSIPAPLRLGGDLAIDGPLSELELDRRLRGLADSNRHAGRLPTFLGAGAYHHYIPAIIDHLILRGEFLTSYTPYQAEFSQGTLQAIFEFQTLICQLTEMEVANASLYDGATALGEAMLMANRITGRKRVLLSAAIHPHYRATVRTLVRHLGLEVQEIPHGPDGRTDTAALDRLLADDVACVAVQSPNFFGCVETWFDAVEHTQRHGALFVGVVAEGISLGLLGGPGRFGADLVVGEGQSFGLPVQFGGPYVGLMASRDRYLRQLPGRLVGEAQDAEGRRGYVLTLSTREQHIRRERATSNICTNQGLCALAATIYLAVVGQQGLRAIARRNLDAATYARRRLSEVAGCSLPFAAPTFNEFVLRLPGPAEAFRRWIGEQGLIAGLPLGRYEAALEDAMLICVTELTRREDIDRLAEAIESGSRRGIR
jgi:glycine dehydrogenase subunit 1